MLGARDVLALQETVGPAKGFTGATSAMGAQLGGWSAQAEARCRSCCGEGAAVGGVLGSSPRDGEEAWGLDLLTLREPGYDRVAVGSPTIG